MIGHEIRHLRVLLVSGALAGAALLARDARAQERTPEGETPATDPAVEARQQYAAGGQAFAAKRFVEAALHFEAAAAQRAHAVTLYTAALAWEQANRPERACDDYGRALEVPGLNAQQAQNARDRVAALERTLGTLAVMAPPGETAWRVQLVGLSEVAAPARLHATPGAHQLLIRAPNRPDGTSPASPERGLHLVEKRDVTLEVGQTLRIELEAEAAAPIVKAPLAKVDANEAPARSAPVSSSGGSLRRSAGFVAVGVGVAALGGGVILGIEALDARDTYNTVPSRATLDHAQGLQTWTNVAFVTGALLTVGGLVLVLLPESKSAGAALTIAPTLGGGALRGSF